MAQKSLLLLTLMVVATISGCASSPTRVEVARAAMGRQEKAVSAPAPTTVTFTPVGCKGGPKYFDSAKDCESTMQSGECSYYTPVNKAGYGSNPVDGKTKFAVPVEEPVCALMRTVNGDHWVAQPAGTEFRFGKEKDGTFSKIPYALHACGNRVMDIFYPQPKKVVSAAAPAQRNICAEKGYSGDEYFTGIDPKTGNLDCLYTVKESFWDTKTGTAIKVVGVIVVVASACKIITNSWSCGVIKHHSAPTSSPPSPPKVPINPGGLGGPIQ